MIIKLKCRSCILNSIFIKNKKEKTKKKKDANECN